MTIDKTLLNKLLEEIELEARSLTLPIESVGLLLIDKNDFETRVQVTPNCISLIKDGDIIKEIIIDKSIREYEESKKKRSIFGFLSN